MQMAEASIHGIDFEIRGSANKGIDALDKLSATLRNLKRITKGGLGLSAVSSFNKNIVSLPFKKAINGFTGMAKGIGGVLKGFKRIVGYRIIRSIIKEITQGFSEGIKNVYVWSKAVGGATDSNMMTFANALDDIATSLKYFKNGVGAAAAPLISALAPAINFVTDAAVQLLNVLNQLFAILTGKSGWTKAVRQTTEFEDAIGGASGAAKEALKYLAPFDELNVLPSQRSGGGGGGGEDYAGMFEDIEDFESGIKDFATKIKEAFENSDWQGLGTIIGDKINELLDSIDYAALGEKVGGYINGLFSTKYWTLETINFEQIGANIAEFLNNTLESIDFDTVGRSITQKWTVIGDLIIGAFETVDWELVGKSIKDFFVGSVDQITDWLNEKDWNQLGLDLVNSLVALVNGLSLTDVCNAIVGFIDAVVNAAIGLLSGIGAAIFGGESYKADLQIELGSVNVKDVTTTGIDKDLGYAIASVLTAAACIVEFAPPLGFVLAAAVIINLGLQGISFIDDPEEQEALQRFWEERGFKGGSKYYDGFKDGFASRGGKFVEDVGLDNITVGITAIINAVHDATLPEAHQMDFTGHVEDFIFPPEIDFVELTGLINKFADSIPDKEKVISAFMVNIIKFADNITSGKHLDNFVAWITGRYNKIPTSERTLNKFVAWITKSTNNIPEKDRTLSGFIAKLFGYELDVKEEDKKLPNFTASVTKVGTTLLKDSQRKIDSATAVIKYQQDGMKRTEKVLSNYSASVNKVDAGALTKEQRRINTTAMMNYVNTTKITPEMRRINTTSVYSKTDFSKLTTADRTVDTVSMVTRVKPSPGKNDGYGNVVVDATANITRVIGQTTLDTTMHLRSGGGVFSGGLWKNIPQFANGGRPHGSLFLAGEAGAELVGHVGNRTEVLNRSQLAATMYAAVRSAMSGLFFRMSNVPAGNYSAEDGDTEEAMYRAMSRALADSNLGGDIELDGDVLYKRMVNRNRANTRLTGVNAMA